MNWIGAFQRALEKIERELDQEIDYAALAREACCSEYNFMRVFSVLSGYTLADYIRCRRLTVAGQELTSEDVRVIDLALKYGYESPEAFSRAFQKFHGISPVQARRSGAKLRCISPLVLKIIIEGGSDMNYRIEKKEAMKFLGYHRRFHGTPAERDLQEEDFFVHTRLRQNVLKGLTGDCDTQYSLIRNADADGYDFYIAAPFGERLTESRYRSNAQTNPEFDELFEIIDIPEAAYAVFETPRSRYPTMQQAQLRRQAVSEWLPGSGYQLAQGTEISVFHWFNSPDPLRSERYIELWLPIEPAAASSSI